MRYLQVFLAWVLLGALVMGSQPASAGVIQTSPQMLRQGQFAVSLYGSWLVEQQFKRQDSYNYRNSLGMHYTSSNPKWDFKIRDDQFYMMQFSYGVLDRLNLYAKVGVVTGGRLESSRLYAGTGSYSDTEKLKTNLVWAVGVRGKIIEFGEQKAGVVLGVEYLRYDDRKLSYDSGAAGSSLTSDEGSMDYWQLDLSALLYVPFSWLTPYFGVAYTFSEAKYDLKWAYNDHTWEGADFTLKDNNGFLPIVGVLVPISPYFSLDLQAVFVARYAGSLSLSYTF